QKRELFEFVTNHPFLYIRNLLLKTWNIWVHWWKNPFPYHHIPSALGWILMLGVSAPILFFGLAGLLSRPKKSTQERLRKTSALAFLYPMLILLPLVGEGRYTLLAQVLVGLWLMPWEPIQLP